MAPYDQFDEHGGYLPAGADDARWCHQPACGRAAVQVLVDRRGEYPCCERHAILKRAGWRCEAIISHPLPWKAGTIRCPIVGSEVDAVGGEARCPRHARQ